VPSDDPTFSDELTLAGLFALPELGTWRKAAEASLRGRPLESISQTTHDGITIEPLYSSDQVQVSTEYPGLPPFTRGQSGLGSSQGSWESCQRCDHPDAELAAGWASENASRGISSAWLVFDSAARAGLDADSDRAANSEADGLIVSTADELVPLLESIDPAITGVHFDGGGNAMGLAAAFFAAAMRSGRTPGSFSGALHLDPLGALASDGELTYGLDRSLALMAELVAWAERTVPGMRTVSVSSLPCAVSGATATQEIAYVLATGVEYLRALDSAGIDVEISCGQFHLVTSVGRDVFAEIAKLRALRRCWARVIEACGGSAAAQASPIHAVSSPRCLAARDPWVNLLRSSEQAFAAVLGGAEVVTVQPFDSVFGTSGDLGRRIAANTHALLREESQLHRVVDPAGGSYYVEQLTDELSRLAWEHFQEIERSGGMRAAFESGRLGDEISAALDEKRTAVATRHDPVTGVSSFPKLDEEAVNRDEIDATRIRARAADRLGAHREHSGSRSEIAALREAAQSPDGKGSVMDAAIEAFAAGATLSEVADALRAGAEPTRVVPLVAEGEGRGFERLRDASDRYLATRGARPQIFLVCLGPTHEHRARADFARNLVNSGGIEVVEYGSFSTAEAAAEAWARSGCSMAIVCAADERAQELARPALRALKEGGARSVVVVGDPRDEEGIWRRAGADLFVFAGCDVLAILRELLIGEGVLDA
jgi:methylmalonyl-CoA mutase